MLHVIGEPGPTPQTHTETEVAWSNGVPIPFDITGPSDLSSAHPNVLFLEHGIACDSTMWREFADAAAQEGYISVAPSKPPLGWMGLVVNVDQVRAEGSLAVMRAADRYLAMERGDLNDDGTVPHNPYIEVLHSYGGHVGSNTAIVNERRAPNRQANIRGAIFQASVGFPGQNQIRTAEEYWDILKAEFDALRRGGFNSLRVAMRAGVLMGRDPLTSPIEVYSALRANNERGKQAMQLGGVAMLRSVGDLDILIGVHTDATKKEVVKGATHMGIITEGSDRMLEQIEEINAHLEILDRDRPREDADYDLVDSHS